MLAQFFAAAAMTGLIWVVQIVVYPQFHDLGAGEFHAYHEAYMTRIGFVVIPLMLAEAGLAGACLWLGWRSRFRRQLLASAGLVAVAWASTFFVQAPMHVALRSSPDPEQWIHSLVATNWIRTAIWTARSVLLAHLILRLR